MAKKYYFNAIKYSNDSSTLAPVVEVEDAKVALLTYVTIKSYGIIIPLADQPKLFSKGFRSVVHMTLGEGTGMGLHNASELVKLFQGKLTYFPDKTLMGEGQEVGWNCFRISL
jgi:signal transduction histidine kinase